MLTRTHIYVTARWSTGGGGGAFPLKLDNGGNDTVNLGPFSSDDIVEVTLLDTGQLDIPINISQDRTGFVFIIGQHENEEPRIENFKFSDRTFSTQDMKELSQL